LGHFLRLPLLDVSKSTLICLTLKCPTLSHALTTNQPTTYLPIELALPVNNDKGGGWRGGRTAPGGGSAAGGARGQPGRRRVPPRAPRLHDPRHGKHRTCLRTEICTQDTKAMQDRNLGPIPQILQTHAPPAPLLRRCMVTRAGARGGAPGGGHQRRARPAQRGPRGLGGPHRRPRAGARRRPDLIADLAQAFDAAQTAAVAKCQRYAVCRGSVMNRQRHATRALFLFNQSGRRMRVARTEHRYPSTCNL